jgi:transcriptional regulator with XRE-family HTH domain
MTFTQFDVARNAGLSERSYRDVETSTRLPTTEQLDDIASALGLNPVQVAHLHRLNRPESAIERSGPPAAYLRALVAAIDKPAVAYNETWTVLAYNKPFAAAMPSITSVRRGPINLLYWYFLNPAAKALFVDWDQTAAHLIACLRHTQAFFADTAPFDALIQHVCRRSPAARQLWDEGTAVAIEPAIATHRLRTRDGGIHTATAATLISAGPYDPRMRLLVCLDSPQSGKTQTWAAAR